MEEKAVQNLQKLAVKWFALIGKNSTKKYLNYKSNNSLT